jgi:ATP adenylyltransferase/5',5'''-P-1,P-4-tetraphosphate phosphorylase II
VNALGFAGSLLVRDEKELSFVREKGPITVLRNVTVPA